MESLGHFIFELIKITILGFIYSTIIYFIYKNIPNNKKPEWCENWFKSKNTLWLYVSILLLFFMFTPFGNHGLGDSARIPISLTKKISNVNWTEYAKLNDVKSSEKNDIFLTQFKIENNVLCGNLKSDFYDYKNSYFVYEKKKKKLEEFQNENDYNKFATNNNLPKSSEFKSFKKNYSDCWSGWRFFLLP